MTGSPVPKRTQWLKPSESVSIAAKPTTESAAHRRLSGAEMPVTHTNRTSGDSHGPTVRVDWQALLSRRCGRC